MLRALTLLSATASLRPAVAAFTCVSGGRSDAECAALGSLYSSAGGAGWARTAGWASAANGTGADYCGFDGVACDVDGHVTSVCVARAAPPARTREPDACCPPLQ